MLKIELGLTSFADNGDMVMPDGTQVAVSNAQRIRDIVEEIELVDQLGLDIYGLGEHHRPDYVIRSSDRTCRRSRTEHIKLASAVTVLSSDDPVRVSTICDIRRSI